MTDKEDMDVEMATGASIFMKLKNSDKGPGNQISNH